MIDDFGPLDATEHTGTVHTVAAIAIGKDESESFAIACMGARKFIPFSTKFRPLNVLSVS